MTLCFTMFDRWEQKTDVSFFLRSPPQGSSTTGHLIDKKVCSLSVSLSVCILYPCVLFNAIIVMIGGGAQTFFFHKLCTSVLCFSKWLDLIGISFRRGNFLASISNSFRFSCNSFSNSFHDHSIQILELNCLTYVALSHGYTFLVSVVTVYRQRRQVMSDIWRLPSTSSSILACCCPYQFVHHRCHFILNFI